MTDQLPPQDLGAERALLGAMLHSREAISDVVDLLTGAEFYRPAHQAIYAAIVAVHNGGDVPDPVTVSAELQHRGQLKQAGDDTYLLELFAAVSVTANAEYYAELISGKAALRKLAESSRRLQQLAHSGVVGEDLDTVLDQARAMVDAATAGYRNRNHDEGVDIGALAAASLDRYAQPEPPGLPSGWHDLDDMLNGGLKPGNLCVVGARTGVGKSVMGINWATHVALSGVGVLLASLEMDRNEVVDRILADRALVKLDRLARHQLDDDDRNRVQRRVHELQDVPLRIEDTYQLSLAKLRSLARDRTRKPGGLGLVVADYLQLMSPADRKAPRQEQVAELSRGLKLLAKELHVPVVAMAQLNREGAKRSSPRPMLSDFRESGAIEQDANVVMLVWDDPEKPGERQVSVAKNRQGRTGDVTLSWSPQYARMRSAARLHSV